MTRTAAGRGGSARRRAGGQRQTGSDNGRPRLRAVPLQGRPFADLRPHGRGQDQRPGELAADGLPLHGAQRAEPVPGLPRLRRPERQHAGAQHDADGVAGAGAAQRPVHAASRRSVSRSGWRRSATTRRSRWTRRTGWRSAGRRRRRSATPWRRMRRNMGWRRRAGCCSMPTSSCSSTDGLRRGELHGRIPAKGRRKTSTTRTSDGKPMARDRTWHRDIDDDPHPDAQHLLRRDPMVYVSGNLLVFYDRATAGAISPGRFRGQGRGKHQRPNYLIREERKGPEVVIELTSRSTTRRGIEDKYELYQDTLARSGVLPVRPARRIPAAALARAIACVAAAIEPIRGREWPAAKQGAGLAPGGPGCATCGFTTRSASDGCPGRRRKRWRRFAQAEAEVDVAATWRAAQRSNGK